MDNKRLAEYVGECWHLNKLHGGDLFDAVCKCGKKLLQNPNPEWLTPDGYNLLHKAISEKGEWTLLSRWLAKDSGFHYYTEEVAFHRLPVEEKAPIIDKALKVGAIGA